MLFSVFIVLSSSKPSNFDNSDDLLGTHCGCSTIHIRDHSTLDVPCEKILTRHSSQVIASLRGPQVDAQFWSGCNKELMHHQLGPHALPLETIALLTMQNEAIRQMGLLDEAVDES